MSLIDDVKVANRINTDDPGLTDELARLIDSALIDLGLLGVRPDKVELITADPLIRSAVVLYTKSHFGFDNPDADRFQTAYEKLRDRIGMTRKYTEVIE